MDTVGVIFGLVNGLAVGIFFHRGKAGLGRIRSYQVVLDIEHRTMSSEVVAGSGSSLCGGILAQLGMVLSQRFNGDLPWSN
jgi:hypothetical protein